MKLIRKPEPAELKLLKLLVSKSTISFPRVGFMTKLNLLLVFSVLVFCRCSNPRLVSIEVIRGDSVLIEYYSKDVRKSISVIRNGAMNGLRKIYYPTGRVFEMGSMLNDKKSGLWVTYNSDSVIINASHYVEDTVFFNLNAENFNFKKYDIDENRVSINAPRNWVEESRFIDSNLVFALREKCDTAAFCTNLIVSKVGGTAIGDFSISMDSLARFLQVAFPQLEIIRDVSTRKFKINGLHAYQTVLVAKINNHSIGMVSTWVKVDNTIYFICGLAINEPSGEFLRYKGLFELISSTFSRSK